VKVKRGEGRGGGGFESKILRWGRIRKRASRGGPTKRDAAVVRASKDFLW
jgi:hypothetical protein